MYSDNPVRKSWDESKVILGMWDEILQSKEKNNRKNLNNAKATFMSARNKEIIHFTIPNLYINCQFKNIKLKVDHHTAGVWFILENKLLSLERSCWSSLV